MASRTGIATGGYPVCTWIHFHDVELAGGEGFRLVFALPATGQADRNRDDGDP
jgi:hypothetical protein